MFICYALKAICQELVIWISFGMFEKADFVEARYLQGQGIARQRQAIVNGLRESVLAFEKEVEDVSAKDVLELMMMTQ